MKKSLATITFIFTILGTAYADTVFEPDFEEELSEVQSIESLCPKDAILLYEHSKRYAIKTNLKNSLFHNEFKGLWCGFKGILYSSNKNDLSFQERYGNFEPLLDEMMNAYEQGMTESNTAMKSKYWTLGNLTVHARSQNFFENMRNNQPALAQHVSLFEDSIINLIKYWDWDVLVDPNGLESLKPLKQEMSIRQLKTVNKYIRAILKINLGRTKSAEIKLDSVLIEKLQNLSSIADNIINQKLSDTHYGSASNYRAFLQNFIEIEPRINKALGAIEEYAEARAESKVSTKTEETAANDSTGIPTITPEEEMATDDLLGALDSFSASSSTNQVQQRTSVARNSKTFRYLSKLVDTIYDLAKMKQLYINEMKKN